MEPSTTVARAAAGAGPLAPSLPAGRSAPEPARFDEKKFKKLCTTSRLSDWLLRYPLVPMRAARWLTQFLGGPAVFKFPFVNMTFVLGYDEVREVLNADKAFPVPWGDRMIQVTQGKNFVLGMPRGAEYRLSYEQLARAFPREDVRRSVTHLAKSTAKQILATKKRQGEFEFDAVQDLITAVPTELCESYYGIKIDDKVQFAMWTLAISKYLFGPSSNADYLALAKAGARELRRTIRASIALANKDPQQAPGIVLPRLIAMKADPNLQITDDVIHGQLFGMVLGFIPTNVLAGGNILETLLRRPDFLERTRAAALADDDDLLWRCLRETLRFRHINPAPWRVCAKAYALGEGKHWQWKFRPGNNVLAIIQSAMFDDERIERPTVFDPDRPDENSMVFGVGQHWCLGAYIAIAQLTKTFKPLLKLKNLAAVRNPAVRTKRYNDLFPVSLMIRFEP